MSLPEVPNKLLTRIRRLTGARTAVAERIQSLWSGYGEILRVELEGGMLDGTAIASVIVKRVRPPAKAKHSRGWNSNRSHQRKLRSYDIEMAWYRDHSGRCRDRCRMPVAYLCESGGGQWTFVMEDLDAAGFAGRRVEASEDEIHACLDWLANFHATFLGAPADGLWKVGTYWHLATRPDELAAIRDPQLRLAAPRFDALLSACSFRTLVHGDAKLENFCFARAGRQVAAVDFQYVGGGCGMKDVAYFLSSCLDSDGCQAWADSYLAHYFGTLRAALSVHQPDTNADALETEWRALYSVAWADFYRFLAGWAPDHNKIHPYSQRMTREAMAGVTAV